MDGLLIDSRGRRDDGFVLRVAVLLLRCNAQRIKTTSAAAMATISTSLAYEEAELEERFFSKQSGDPDQIPPPSSNASLRALAWVMTLFGGTSRVSQTPPPIDEPWPIVTRPSTVAPA
jgi:hypothetical protein